jgi:hypothetical protein
MKYERVLTYVPGLDNEFSEDCGSYKLCYVDHDPLSDECIARFRRYRLFLDATELEEEQRIPSFRHCDIHEFLRPLGDHASSWWLGKIPFWMTEPYCDYDFNMVGFEHFIVPENIALYGGGPFTDAKGFKAPTTGVIFVQSVHARYLAEVACRLTEVSKTAPAWNSVTEQERRAAKKRVTAEKRLAKFGGADVCYF